MGISESTVRSFLRRHKPDTEKEVQEQRLSLEKSRHSQSLTAVVRIGGSSALQFPHHRLQQVLFSKTASQGHTFLTVFLFLFCSCCCLGLWFFLMSEIRYKEHLFNHSQKLLRYHMPVQSQKLLLILENTAVRLLNTLKNLLLH